MRPAKLHGAPCNSDTHWLNCFIRQNETFLQEDHNETGIYDFPFRKYDNAVRRCLLNRIVQCYWEAVSDRSTKVRFGCPDGAAHTDNPLLPCKKAVPKWSRRHDLRLFVFCLCPNYWHRIAINPLSGLYRTQPVRFQRWRRSCIL